MKICILVGCYNYGIAVTTSQQGDQTWLTRTNPSMIYKYNKIDLLSTLHLLMSMVYSVTISIKQNALVWIRLTNRSTIAFICDTNTARIKGALILESHNTYDWEIHTPRANGFTFLFTLYLCYCRNLSFSPPLDVINCYRGFPFRSHVPTTNETRHLFICLMQ